MTQSSSGRRWSNVLVERWGHAPGELPSLTPRATEVAVLLRGRTLVDRVGSGMRQVRHGHPGTVWLCPSGINEDYINVAQPIEDCLHIFLPDRPFAESMLRDLDIDPSKVELRYETIDQDAFIDSVASLIVSELSHETSAGPLLMETLGLALSAHLVHRYSAVNIRPKPAGEKPIDRKRLARVMDFIHCNLDTDLSVATLASIACMSPAHFARSFRAATGRPPHEYISEQRLSLAKQRLRDVNNTLADIAAAAGFSSPSNFARAFRNAVGVTPTQFRAGTDACHAGGAPRTGVG
jgi:AraC family transcriptional regulator